DIADDTQDYLLDREGIEIIQYSIGGNNSMDPIAGESDDAIFFIKYNEDFENFETEQKKVMDNLKESTEKGEWTSQSTQDTQESELTLFVYGDSIDDIERSEERRVGNEDRSRCTQDAGKERRVVE